MQTNLCRRPNLGDAMILVVAAALALAVSRQVGKPSFSTTIQMVLGPDFSTAGAPAPLRFEYAVQRWAIPWLLALPWSAAMVRLRRPRPPLRRLWRQPGSIASLMAILASLGVGALFLARRLMDAMGYKRLGIMTDSYFLSLAIFTGGLLITSGWLSLSLARRLRRERGWIDGLGTLVGISWVVTNLALIVNDLLLS